MKSTSFIIGVILLLANFAFGLLLSSYSSFNMVLNSVIIIINLILLFLLGSITMKDGFKVSLDTLFPLFAIWELYNGFCAPHHLQDNSNVIFILVLVIIEVILLAVTHYISKSVE